MRMKVVTNRVPPGQVVLVTVQSTRGSVPREVGAWMVVSHAGIEGTIGGGHVELEATRLARGMIDGGDSEAMREWTLGPGLGQCCGGTMQLKFERVEDGPSLESRIAPQLAPLALFGGGHVGRAIVNALAPLPFAVTWIDSRDEIFPPDVPGNVQCEHSDPVQGAVPHLAAGSRVLVMSFSHAEDLDVVAALLKRLREKNDLPFAGLIGSRTKWATFRHRLEQRGFSAHELDRITCPIGIPGIRGKQPAVIAASVVAQLLQAAPA
jgi:xanthine dehydrogenase accessory factor